MAYFQAIGVSLEGLDMLIASELLQCPTMGEIKREGFLNGWNSEKNATTLEQQAAAIASCRSQLGHPLSRLQMKKIYKHSFVIARQPGEKALPLETAIEFWRLLFSEPSLAWRSPTSPWLDWWIDFLETEYKRSVNKDLWNQTISFVEKSLEDESLEWWDENGAWPGVIDEFVVYVKQKNVGIENDAYEMELA